MTTPQEKPSDTGAGLGCLFTLAIMIALPLGGYTALNDAGYIQHTHTVDLYMAGDWLVGENRTCIAFETVPTGKQGDPEVSSLDCPVGDYTERPHNVEVKFWGKVSRPELLRGTDATGGFEWRCLRQADGFTCYALN